MHGSAYAVIECVESMLIRVLGAGFGRWEMRERKRTGELGPEGERERLNVERDTQV